jgi:hypothetical protein
MKVTRVHTGADGESHFDEIEVEIEKLQPGDGIIFRHAPPGDYTTGIGRLDVSL